MKKHFVISLYCSKYVHNDLIWPDTELNYTSSLHLMVLKLKVNSNAVRIKHVPYCVQVITVPLQIVGDIIGYCGGNVKKLIVGIVS